IAVHSKYPDIKCTIFDLPPVCELAERHIKKLGLEESIRVVSGDMFNEPLPPGADIITLGHILHDWDDERCVAILKKCYDALPSGGVVLVSEKFLNEEKTGPLRAALLSLSMLVTTIGGRERTASEYSHLFTAAGFVEPAAKVLSRGVRDYTFARKP